MMLSERARSLTRKIDTIVMKERPKVPLVSHLIINQSRKFTVVTFLQVKRCQQT